MKQTTKKSAKTVERQTPKNNSKRNAILMISLIVAIISIVLYLYLNPSITSITARSNADPIEQLQKTPLYLPLENPSSAYYPHIIGKVPKVDWLPTLPLFEFVSPRNWPVVLRNTVADTWPARKKWSLSNLNTRAEELHLYNLTLQNVYQHDRPTFGPYWEPTRPLASNPSLVQPNKHSFIDLSLSAFISRIFNGSSKDYYYWSGNINQLGPFALDLSPDTWKWFESDPTATKQNVNVWLGQNSTTAALHYDAYANFNVQLFGRKRWFLFSPSTPLYLYPFLHPAHAQAQGTLDISLFANHSAFWEVSPEKVQGYEVILEPGDVLYVPPLWFHKVIALEPSVAANIWSIPAQSQALKRAMNELSILKKFNLREGGAHWNGARARRNIAVYFLTEVVKEFHTNPAAFVKYIYDQRYSRLVQNGELALKQHDENTIPEWCGSESITRKEFKIIKKELQTDIELVAKAIRVQPKDTHDVWLGNLIEAVAAEIDKKSYDAPSFLLQCF